ncbi:MAG: hypothetical protein JWO38_2029 [Gemmataceae bacterium]|nr:hypothetical protein [Gemmataceae bacterium]
MNRPGSSRLLVAAPPAAGIALLAGLLLSSGCTKPTTGLPRADPTRGAETKTDPWEAAAKRLRKETDLAACKAALNQLNIDLASRSEVPGPAPLGPDDMKALAALVPLAPPDADEVRPASYTGLDPVYLADCFYFRDAARSLDPGGTPPADLARVGFAWVCRQVYLNPWVVSVEPDLYQVAALPPTAVLQRGHGSGLERAYVFLALLQQMGLDACLIGPPTAGNKPAGPIATGPGGKILPVLPKGPFWAVGVRAEADVLLFDPWRGQPFPGPDGKGVGTLAQVKSDPNQLKAWFEDKTTPWDVTPDDVRTAAVFLAVPVSGLSPRMAMLDDKLKADTGARVAVNPTDLRARFLAASPAGPGLPAAEARFWGPPTDRFAYGRVTSGFLPPSEGGRDQSGPVGLFAQYRLHLIPRTVIVFPPVVALAPESPPAMRLRSAAAGLYEAAFFAPPSPRERIQRGQFQDAARDLTEKQQAFGRGLERLRIAAPDQIVEWCKVANEVHAALRAAQYPDPLQRNPQPDTDPGVAAARGAVEDFWKEQAATAQLIIDAASARVGRAEATFLLALAKHEEAERLQLQAERATGADSSRVRVMAANAWGEAANAWEAYLEQSGNLSGFPGREGHAKALAGRAEKLAQKK